MPQNKITRFHFYLQYLILLHTLTVKTVILQTTVDSVDYVARQFNLCSITLSKMVLGNSVDLHTPSSLTEATIKD